MTAPISPAGLPIPPPPPGASGEALEAPVAPVAPLRLTSLKKAAPAARAGTPEATTRSASALMSSDLESGKILQFDLQNPLAEAWALFVLEASAGCSDIYIYDNGTYRVRSKKVSKQFMLPHELSSPEAFLALCEAYLGMGELMRLNSTCCPAIDRSVVMHNIRFRASLDRGTHGRDLTMRRITEKLPSLDDLMLPKEVMDYFFSLREGLVLLVAPTGRGKSTTLSVLFDERAKRIAGGEYITLEDPIEYVYPKYPNGSIFRQRELARDFPSFSIGLEAALRQSFDCIQVGEVRNSEVADMVVRASQSGHVTVATLHAPNAAGGVERFADLLPRDSLGALSEALKIVVAQDLIFAPKGYPQEVVPLHEILVNDTQRSRAVASKIKEGKFHLLQQEIEAGKTLGMQTFGRCRASRVEEGYLPSGY